MKPSTSQLVRERANEPARVAPAYPHYPPATGHWRFLRLDLLPLILIACLRVWLKGLLSGESRHFDVASGSADPKLEIECDRLVPGQRIGFGANLR
jgi:hypothetical protein